jgi:hypothetical protein
LIELYAITDHPAPPLPDVAPLQIVTLDGLAAVYSTAPKRDASPEALWRHEQVVEALMKDRDLLPVRYGTQLDDAAAVVRAVDPRRDELAAALDRVRGAVELSLRVVAADTPPPGGPQRARANGAEHLRARAHATAVREAAIRTLHDPLAALARASTTSSPPDERELLRAAYLVKRDVVDRFVASVARLQRANPGLRLLCTGPWPPYSFAQR